LFDLLASENMDNICCWWNLRINSPKCSFVAVAWWFDFTNFIQHRLKIHSNMWCEIQKCVSSGYWHVARIQL